MVRRIGARTIGHHARWMELIPDRDEMQWHLYNPNVDELLDVIHDKADRAAAME